MFEVIVDWELPDSSSQARGTVVSRHARRHRRDAETAHRSCFDGCQRFLVSYSGNAWSTSVSDWRDRTCTKDRTMNRYYDPASGQFLSVDPDLGTTGTPFAYATDNPISNVDSLGLAPRPGPPPACDHAIISNPHLQCHETGLQFSWALAEQYNYNLCRLGGTRCAKQISIFDGLRIPDFENITDRAIIEVKVGYQPWTQRLQRQSSYDRDAVNSGAFSVAIWNFYPNRSGISWPTVPAVKGLLAKNIRVNIYYYSPGQELSPQDAYRGVGIDPSGQQQFRYDISNAGSNPDFDPEDIPDFAPEFEFD